MTELTFSEMLRLGGVPTYVSFLAGIFIITLIIMGYFSVARRRPNGPVVKKWAWAILVCGLICTVNGGVGTVTGLVNVHRAAAVAAAAPAEGPAALAQGVYEVLCNVAISFGCAFLALFGYALVRLAALRS